jgi:hypothetical protein
LAIANTSFVSVPIRAIVRLELMRLKRDVVACYHR